MPNLLGMSFEGELAPSFDLTCLKAAHTLPDGWGIGYYPGGEPSASVLKEPAAREGSIRSELVKAWEHLASSMFVLHIRTATWGGRSDANTQPFSRSFGGRDWLIAHAGSLTARLEAPADPRLQPVGSTDTETLFCRVLEGFAAQGWRNLGEVPPEALRDTLIALNRHGSLNLLLTDGRDLAAWSDAHGQGGLHVWQVLPPYATLAFGDADLEVDLTRRGTKSRKGVVISSEPLPATSSAAAEWRRLPAGHLMLVRQGAIRTELGPDTPHPTIVERVDAAPPPTLRSVPPATPSASARPSPALPARTIATPRDLVVYHRTTYKYERPVERSTHHLRLSPAHDRLQRLLSHDVRMSVDGQSCDYDDVFGNRSRRVLLETPYTELTIEARSRVQTLDVDPLGTRGPHVRSTIPLVWMPWQRHMLQPFLLPPELPDSELQELAEYAMSFVTRNGSDLHDTLFDMSRAIYNEYEYRAGATRLSTTAFDVYVNRRGVCQDFTNLFICLARLLGVPARYVCGYVFTGPKGDGPRAPEASHAWAQVYLPDIGWIGFDPTNGCITRTEHVRVAVGRNYRDATPTAGTIYVGGGPEVLDVEVRVDLLDGA